MTHKLITAMAVLVGLVFTFTPLTATALDPAPKCESGKLKEAGKYSFCRLKADAKGVKKSKLPDYFKCADKFTTKWDKLELKAAGQCPSNGDKFPMEARITTDADEIATLVAGGSVPPACALPLCPVDGGSQACTTHDTSMLCSGCPTETPAMEFNCLNAVLFLCENDAFNDLCASKANEAGCAEFCCP